MLQGLYKINVLGHYTYRSTAVLALDIGVQVMVTVLILSSTSPNFNVKTRTV